MRNHWVLLTKHLGSDEGHITGQTPKAGGFFSPSPPKVLCQYSLEAQQVLLVPALSAKCLLFFFADNLHSV